MIVLWPLDGHQKGEGKEAAQNNWAKNGGGGEKQCWLGHMEPGTLCSHRSAKQWKKDVQAISSGTERIKLKLISIYYHIMSLSY